MENDERIDDLQLSGLFIIQSPHKFCFGIDAVLLANFAVCNEGETVLDLCTGTGAIPILMSAKTAARSFTAIEIQEDLADMATRSVSLNNLTDRITVINGDLMAIDSYIKPCSIDVVTVNPPYMKAGGGLLNDKQHMAIARHEIKCTLEGVVQAAAFALKPLGRFYIVHRPARLHELLAVMIEKGIQPKTLKLVYPSTDKNAVLCLVAGVKGGGSELKVLPPEILG